MRNALLIIGIAVALHACGRDEPAMGDSTARSPVDQTRQIEKAADAGKSLGADATPGDAPKPLSDTSLTQIVKSALQSESSLDAGKIDVENRNGNVALHGSVASEEQKEKAGRIVGSVGGVRNVANNLTVDPSASTGASADSALPDPKTSGLPPPTSGLPPPGK